MYLKTTHLTNSEPGNKNGSYMIIAYTSLSDCCSFFYLIPSSLLNFSLFGMGCRPGRFPGIAGNAENHGNDGKFHKSHQIFN